MAKVLVIGGHGKIALLTEPMLVAGGHDTTAVVRNRDHVSDVESTGARARVADIEMLDQPPQVDEMVAGYDVVVWSAGAGGGNPARTKAVDQDAALRVLDAVVRSGARFIMVSYFGSTRTHGVPADNGFYAYAEAKSIVDEAIRDSVADWVILAPSGLTLESEGGIELDPSTGAEASGSVAAGQIPRATVARLIAEVVDRGDLNSVTLRCNGGDKPIADALA
ncbi:NAD(P)H-binding protein [Cumulibacter soli]|uniref:NAD(P)H-binding protein n=1 Tax=Cumulibacter soli TaxID=2546344 RepID=UPI00106783E4|nr:NAD(P)H-binding protein [Cumulibacter soli]